MDELGHLIATAILGLDTLWGGDVMSASGTGRMIADSWFADEPLPPAYSSPAAARLRQSGGVAGAGIDRPAIDSYIREVDIPAALAGLRRSAISLPRLRREYLDGLALSLETMWELVLEKLGSGPAVPYARTVEAATGAPPSPSAPLAKRQRVEELLRGAGFSGGDSLAERADGWRQQRLISMHEVQALGARVIAGFDRLSERHLVPYLPAELRAVPRANIEFLPIESAWFSGSMNYLGRKRNADGSPQYEAAYEINASLEISAPEFDQLVSHEVVPGHVTTFAYLQNLYHRGQAGFEATVLTMNTRAATLFEGIANNAILIAHGVTEVDQLPDETLQIGVLLALLQDDAKNHSSYLTWAEGMPQAEVAAILRRDFLVSRERADKLSGAWGRHPLMGRMYLPAYRAGTEKVARLRRRYQPERILPALYGCHGLVDISTVDLVLD